MDRSDVTPVRKAPTSVPGDGVGDLLGEALGCVRRPWGDSGGRRGKDRDRPGDTALAGGLVLHRSINAFSSRPHHSAHRRPAWGAQGGAEVRSVDVGKDGLSRTEMNADLRKRDAADGRNGPKRTQGVKGSWANPAIPTVKE